MPKDYFDERIAERHDADMADQSTPEAVEPVVAFLADLVGEGNAL
jgi:hypothetical protein